MKNFIILSILLTTVTSAFAGESIKLNCSLTGVDGSIATNVVLKAGMPKPVKCPNFVCDGIFSTSMNYNNLYEQVTVRIENKELGQVAETSHQNLKVGSMFDLSLQNKNTPTFLTVSCDVSK